MEKHRTNNRQNWIDIAKGILIFIVALGHIGFCTKDETYKDVFGFTSQLTLFYISYYIPAFFVITGMCRKTYSYNILATFQLSYIFVAMLL